MILLAASLAGGCGSRDGAGPARPHVIVVSFDTTRADRLSPYGCAEARTPNLDALARDSILFTECMTTAPTTLAAHLSLFTGRHPHSHGVPRNGFILDPANVTLAEILSGAGYRTAAFIASFALDARFGVAQGFDHFDAAFDRIFGEGEIDQDQRDAESVTDAVLDYLDADAAEPRFLFVHYFDPHLPYEPRFPEAGLRGEPDPPPAIDVGAVRERSTLRLGVPFPEALRLAARYDSEISHADRAFGRLLAGIRERGILDRAILLVVADHGENFWDHEDTFDHGHTVFETTIHAAALVRLPRDPARRAGAPPRGRLDTSPVSHVDWVPTLLDRLGLAIPPGVEGRVLDLDARRGRPALDDPHRARFAEATKPWMAVEEPGRWYNLAKARCIRLGPWKYVRTPYLDLEELFQLERDPGERVNLFDLLRGRPSSALPTPDELDRLRSELEAWDRSAAPFPTRFEEVSPEETVERLRRLGYLGAEAEEER